MGNRGDDSRDLVRDMDGDLRSQTLRFLDAEGRERFGGFGFTPGGGETWEFRVNGSSNYWMAAPLHAGPTLVIESCHAHATKITTPQAANVRYRRRAKKKKHRAPSHRANVQFFYREVVRHRAMDGVWGISVLHGLDELGTILEAGVLVVRVVVVVVDVAARSRCGLVVPQHAGKFFRTGNPRAFFNHHRRYQAQPVVVENPPPSRPLPSSLIPSHRIPLPPSHHVLITHPHTHPPSIQTAITSSPSLRTHQPALKNPAHPTTPVFPSSTLLHHNERHYRRPRCPPHPAHLLPRQTLNPS